MNLKYPKKCSTPRKEYLRTFFFFNYFILLLLQKHNCKKKTLIQLFFFIKILYNTASTALINTFIINFQCCLSILTIKSSRTVKIWPTCYVWHACQRFTTPALDIILISTFLLTIRYGGVLLDQTFVNIRLDFPEFVVLLKQSSFQNLKHIFHFQTKALFQRNLDIKSVFLHTRKT